MSCPRARRGKSAPEPPVPPAPGREPGEAWIALAEHETRTSGRLLRRAGLESLHGRLSVGEVIARSAVERVEDAAGVAIAHEHVLTPRGAVRPVWTARGSVLRIDRADCTA